MLGHDTLLGSQQKPRVTRKFLEGILSTQRLFQLYVHYEIFNDFYLKGAVNLERVQKEKQTETFKEIFLGVVLRY